MRQQVSDDGDANKYWTQLPNIVFEIGLKPLELALYAHLKRAAGANPNGKCFKSTATLARETGMGAGTVSRTKTALESRRSVLGNRPLIKTRQIPNPKGGKAFQEITITDIWKVNTDRFTPSTVEVDTPETSSPMEIEGPKSSSTVEVGGQKPSSIVELEAQNQVPETQKPSSKPTSTVEIKKNYKNNQEEEKQNTSAFARLMAFHAANIVGPIPDAGAQGSALKFLLEHYTPEQCEAAYQHQASELWRDSVSWLTVKKFIGGWLASKDKPKPTPAKAKTMPWAGRVYAVGDVISDDGDRYTVMGDDGTPSKRWRTPEAFALDTGRDVEQVRARWN